MQKKKGISLIVLVITIIVMIILAATIIISLNNNGIINKAQDAVDKTNEKQVEELASLAWAEAYADNVGKPEDKLQPILKAAVEKALTDNGIVLSEYGISVTTKGVKLAKGWLQVDENCIVKGQQTLAIGDYVNYNPGTIASYESKAEKNGVTNQIFDNNSYVTKTDATNANYTKYTEGRWRVLGAEDGKVKLISASIIQPSSGGKTLDANYADGTAVTYKFFQLKGEKGYIYCEEELNNICALYGNGQYAESARSVKMEDLMASSKDFDPYTIVLPLNSDHLNRNSGGIGSYGYTVTYKLNNDGTKVIYTSENGAVMEQDPNMFYHYDETTKTFLRSATLGTTYTLTNKNTEYFPIRIYNVGNGELSCKGIKFYDVIYEDTWKYHSSFVATRGDFCNFKGYNSYGVFVIQNNGCERNTLCKPKNDTTISETTLANGVRAVVILEEGVILSDAKSNIVQGKANYTTWNITK